MLLSESRRRNLLDGENPFILVQCPVHLLHGKLDADIPWTRVLEISEALESPRVQTTLIQKGDHRLSEEGDIAQILSALEDLVSMIAT